jgi:hypothetical protein
MHTLLQCIASLVVRAASTASAHATVITLPEELISSPVTTRARITPRIVATEVDTSPVIVTTISLIQQVLSNGFDVGRVLVFLTSGELCSAFVQTLLVPALAGAGRPRSTAEASSNVLLTLMLGCVPDVPHAIAAMGNEDDVTAATAGYSTVVGTPGIEGLIIGGLAFAVTVILFLTP